MVRAQQFVQNLSRHKDKYTFLQVEVAGSKSESIAERLILRRVYLRCVLFLLIVFTFCSHITGKSCIVSCKKNDREISKKTTGIDSFHHFPEDVFFVRFPIKTILLEVSTKHRLLVVGCVVSFLKEKLT